MTLGLPYFTAFHIILDKDQQQVTFSPGCGCNTNDKYPLILTDNLFKYCTSNTTPSSTSTEWTCQTYTPWIPAVTTTIGTTKNRKSSSTKTRMPILLILVTIASAAL
jgi:hypothetical protein